MTFLSKNLTEITSESSKAQKFINMEIERIKGPFDMYKNRFDLKVRQEFLSQEITDEKEIAFGQLIKSEYLTEINLEQSEEMLQAVMTTANSNLSPEIKKLDFNGTNKETYSQILNIIAETAKASYEDTMKMSYSNYRLSCGIYMFVFASSLIGRNYSLFKDEDVSTTLIYCSIMQSIQGVKYEAYDEAILIDLNSIKKLKEIQARIIHKLAIDKIMLGEWQRLDNSYSDIAEKIKDRIKSIGDLPENASELTKVSKEFHDLAVAAVPILKDKKEIFKTSYKRTKSRLATGYF
jgi:hypothetical protein